MPGSAIINSAPEEPKVTTIAILPEPLQEGMFYRAVAGQRQSVGRTPGEALDTLAGQLPEAESGTLVVVQHMRPDEFFTSQQRERLALLMERWRQARDSGNELSAEEQADLDALVAAELEATTRRAESLNRQIQQ
jgi:hypothetical protein